MIAVALMRIQATIKTKGLAKSQRFVCAFVVWKKYMAVYLVFVSKSMIIRGECVCFYIYLNSLNKALFIILLQSKYAYIRGA